MSKLKDLLKIGTAVAKPFAPGAVGSVLEAVNSSIQDKGDVQNEGALKALANRVDECEHAILVLHERLKKLGG
ncbi:MAG TPA: hypothetical protein VGO43_00340 [Pyrinomonadaceae bacterium]|jgi:hypothetical protein|nr:hypothetical protein [Pyrinomonadaceae bacterium]